MREVQFCNSWPSMSYNPALRSRSPFCKRTVNRAASERGFGYISPRANDVADVPSLTADGVVPLPRTRIVSGDVTLLLLTRIICPNAMPTVVGAKVIESISTDSPGGIRIPERCDEKTVLVEVDDAIRSVSVPRLPMVKIPNECVPISVVPQSTSREDTARMTALVPLTALP